MKSLGQHYSVPILIELYSAGEVYKTSIQKKVVKTLSTLDKVLEELRDDDLIVIDNKMERGNEVFRVSLTPKGRIVAENLTHLEENRITIPEGLVSEIEKIIKRDKSHSSVEEYVKSHSSVEEYVNEAVRKAIEKWKREHAVG